ncbi:MAG TPA: exonuclease domain-containing protein, partial [Gammaproteobacteria bacterium]|nr:exonuclease domain-containing protein [Gammaproteobacteria bacterium]
MWRRQHRGSGIDEDWTGYFARRAAASRSPLLRRYFQAGCLAGETAIGEVPLVAMDMETTGLDESRHAIVSIGIVPFTLRRIHMAARRHWIVKPPRPLSERSVTFHHITHSDIAAAPDLREVLPELLEGMAGRVVVVHFRNIERPFLDAAVRARLGEALLFPVIDTMALEARRHRLSLWSRVARRLG